jgi:hypothetical protein
LPLPLPSQVQEETKCFFKTTCQLVQAHAEVRLTLRLGAKDVFKRLLVPLETQGKPRVPLKRCSSPHPPTCTWPVAFGTQSCFFLSTLSLYVPV